MSSNVVIRQVRASHTETTTTTSALLLNVGYITSMPGILKILQVLICCTSIGIIGYYFTVATRYDTHMLVPELFYLLVATSCLITTTLLFLSCFCSISSATYIPRSIFEAMYHLVATLLFLTAGLTLLIRLHKDSSYSTPHYEPKVAAAGLGLVNFILYLLSAIYSIRTFKKS